MNKIAIPNDIMLAEVSRLLAEGRPVVIATKGNSMMPFIVGDRDSVELVRKDNYEVGDIVLSQISPGHWVLHRLFSIDAASVVLKGDGNLTGTEKCRMEDIAGYAVSIIRPDGEVSCLTPRFVRRSARWRALPYIVRRVYLAIFRRII